MDLFDGIKTQIAVGRWRISRKMREFDLFPVEEFVRWFNFLAHRGEWGSLKEGQSDLLGNREPRGLV